MTKYSNKLHVRERKCEHSAKLGVPTKALYNWKRIQRLERGEAPKGLRPGETPEQVFKRLEREIEELREANYILEKALHHCFTAFFVSQDFVNVCLTLIN